MESRRWDSLNPFDVESDMLVAILSCDSKALCTKLSTNVTCAVCSVLTFRCLHAC